MTPQQAKKQVTTRLETVLNVGWSDKKGDLPPSLDLIAVAASSANGVKPAHFRVFFGLDKNKGWQGNLFVP